MVAATWSAFGVATFTNFINFYQSRYNPSVVFPFAVDITMAVVYLVLAILTLALPAWNQPGSSAYLLIGPIVFSALEGVTLGSLMIGYPWTRQQTRGRVSAEVAASPEFHRFNMALTGYFAVIFGIAVILSWVSWALAASLDASAHTAFTVVIVLIPLLGVLAVPLVVSCIKGDWAAGDGGTAGAGDVPGAAEEEKEGLLERGP